MLFAQSVNSPIIGLCRASESVATLRFALYRSFFSFEILVVISGLRTLLDVLAKDK